MGIYVNLQSPWEVRKSSSKKLPYFFNTETKQSSWDAPRELSQDEINQLPGAEEHLKGGKPDHAVEGQVRASHLLIKHSGSRRPSSWKEAQITRSKEEAIEILRRHQAEINGSSQKFAELAQIHSDCSSHEHGGDLGWFKRGQMQKPFEDAAYGLEVGEISDVISSDSGVHLVLRTG
ncbi:rotamase-domain-containing protein [Phlegmacium glaucopus]|nr:rotamase-domain-containing protein [Phlegmacium glaucopus]